MTTNATPPHPQSVDYPKAHESLHFGSALWWFGSLEATDTDVGESFHTVVKGAWRSLNTGKSNLLQRIAERVLFITWHSSFDLPPTPFERRASEWHTRCLSWRAACVLNPDGVAFSTLETPVRSRRLTSSEGNLFSRIPGGAIQPFSAWTGKHVFYSQSLGLSVRLPAGTLVGPEPLPRDRTLQIFTKVRLRFPSGNTNMISLPAYLDTVVETPFEGQDWRALSPILAVLCFAPAPPTVATASGTPTPDADNGEVYILYTDLRPTVTDVSGCARVAKPDAGSRVALMNCASIRGESVVALRPSLLQEEDATYLHHWLQAGLAGKQRQTSQSRRWRR